MIVIGRRRTDIGINCRKINSKMIWSNFNSGKN